MCVLVCASAGWLPRAVCAACAAACLFAVGRLSAASGWCGRRRCLDRAARAVLRLWVAARVVVLGVCCVIVGAADAVLVVAVVACIGGCTMGDTIAVNSVGGIGGTRCHPIADNIGGSHGGALAGYSGGSRRDATDDTARGTIDDTIGVAIDGLTNACNASTAGHTHG